LSPLDAAITSLEHQNDSLGKARNDYLLKEAEKKNFEATMVQKAQGKSHAEKVVNAQAQEAWVAFAKDLARLEAVYEFQRLKFTILEKSWQTQYLQTKLDEDLVRKQR
jgi:hypothetical protein